jgi:hypothetical protein
MMQKSRMREAREGCYHCSQAAGYPLHGFLGDLCTAMLIPQFTQSFNLKPDSLPLVPSSVVVVDVVDLVGEEGHGLAVQYFICLAEVAVHLLEELVHLLDLCFGHKMHIGIPDPLIDGL